MANPVKSEDPNRDLGFGPPPLLPIPGLQSLLNLVPVAILKEA